MTQLILRNIAIAASEADNAAFQIAEKKLKSVGIKNGYDYHIHRRSVDARKKERIRLVCSVLVSIEGTVSEKQLS